jgi:hypothetical protein
MCTLSSGGNIIISFLLTDGGKLHFFQKNHNTLKTVGHHSLSVLAEQMRDSASVLRTIQ